MQTLTDRKITLATLKRFVVRNRATHSPAPFRVDWNEDHCPQTALIRDAKGKTVARVTTCAHDCGNANLFAAAPDLLAALRECLTDPGAMAWNDPEIAYRRLRAINDITRAAIARAEAGLDKRPEPGIIPAR